MLHSLVYVSAASPALTGTDMDALLEQSRRHNQVHQITGLLLYRAGTFLQFLEGTEDAVEQLYATIATDERHHDIILVRRRSQPVRQFPNWTMAFGDVDPKSTEPVAVQMAHPKGPTPRPKTKPASSSSYSTSSTITWTIDRTPSTRSH